MEWRDQGVLLSVRLHGESAAIIEVFTAAHGRHAGVVRGGASRKMAATLQPGSQLQVTWRARLDHHIGAFTVEPLQSRAALLSDHLSLSGLNAICALLHVALPEREEHAALWRATMPLLAAMERGGDWLPDYLRWEMLLLEELGFGLDLTRCAVTGSRDSGVRVSARPAARMPAMRAVASTSALGSPSRRTRSSTSAVDEKRPFATATRRVTAFAPTSTMRARPSGARM